MGEGQEESQAELNMHNVRAASFSFIGEISQDCRPGDSLFQSPALKR